MKRLKSLLIGLVCLVALPIIYTNNVYADDEGTIIAYVGPDVDASVRTDTYETTRIKTCAHEHCNRICTFGYKYAATWSDIFDISKYEYVVIEHHFQSSGTCSDLAAMINLKVVDNDNRTNTVYAGTTVNSLQRSNPIFSKDVKALKVDLTGHIIYGGGHNGGYRWMPSYVKIIGYGTSHPKFDLPSGNLTHFKISAF